MSVTVQTIPTESSATTLNEFFVPTILSFSLRKTQEDRNSAVRAEGVSSLQNGGNQQNVTEEENESQTMTPKKKEKSQNKQQEQQQSSFLLQPFFKPVDPHIEVNRENPVLRALFGGKSASGLQPWSYVTRTSVNNCHPFKKTELSHDLTSDDTPAEVPKSLRKNSTPLKRRMRKVSSFNNHVAISKKDNTSMKSSKISLHVTNREKQIKDNAVVLAKNFTDSVSLYKRKKFVSQPSLSTSKSHPQYINSERLIQLRTIVDNAVKNHKVYSMTGCYNSVRNALRQRGWIEKIDSDVKGRRRTNKFEEVGLYDAAFQFVQKNQTIAAMKLTLQTNSGFAHNDQIHYSGQGEAEIINRMLRNVTEDLCWLSRPYPYYSWKDFDKFEMINRLPRAYFSNKVGLCNSLQQIQWFYESGVCSTQFPRTYNTSMKEELEAFKEDFRLTACVGLLKWFLQAFKSGGEKAVRSPEGKVDMNVIEFALRRCAEYVKTKQHEDIDIIDTPTVWDYQWDQFITQYYKIVNEGQILKDGKEGVAIMAIVSNVQSMLNILKPHYHQFDIEGYQNFWIVKPGGRCCGAGIVIKNSLEQILMVVNPVNSKETRYVVQKYIERPLLIYNTKFDIRQWFLVTNVYPLTVWMYKESYLRFCSQPFTLKNTHESIHLCNNAVQRKYKNGKRDRGLPDENMWDCYTFQTYLKTIGHPDVWEKCIYPGMKEGFVGALLASQDSMDRKKNCFELYGADFMISDTLTDGPWLIEINSNPAMDSSTSVTARMCPQVLEDIIKVVIDRRDNKSASTGAFEMVFRQNCPPIPPYLGMSLCVKGKKAYKAVAESRIIGKKSKSKHSPETLLSTDTEEDSIGEDFASTDSIVKTPKSDKSSATKKNKVNSQGKISVSTNKLVETKKEKGRKRLKVDWVKKNIDDIKSAHSIKMRPSKCDDECSDKSKEEALKDVECSEEFAKFFEDSEMKEFLHKILMLRKKLEESKQETAQKNPEKQERQSADEDFDITKFEKESLLTLLKICRQKVEGKEVCWNDLYEEIKESNMHLASSNSMAKSCPNFDLTFEKELKLLEEEQKNSLKSKSDESLEIYLSATSCVSKSSSKTSLDYFRDWKSKINDSCRAYEDIIAKFNTYRGESSKIKYQDTFSKRIQEELELLKTVCHGKGGKKVGKAVEKETNESKEKVKNYEGEELYLAINAETGAVKGIKSALPLIKQRRRPVLPNGCSGHGRKISATTDMPTIGRKLSRFKETESKNYSFRRMDDYFYVALPRKFVTSCRRF